MDHDRIVGQITSVRWDVSEFQDVRSPYVDFILDQFRLFSDRLQETGFALSAGARVSIWDAVATHTFQSILDGFASIKR